MILTRLYELAKREELLADPAFEKQPVPFIIHVDDGGALRGVASRRGQIVIPPKKKGGEPRTKPDAGMPASVPRAHGNAASQGFARFFADTVSRVVPMAYDLADDADKAGELSKRRRSRATFWQQVDRAADETSDPALRAVQAFGRRLASDPSFAADAEARFAERQAKATERCTFAYHPDGGPTILEREPVRAWYREFFRAYTGGKQEAGPSGLCQVTGEPGPIPTTHPIKLQVPGWMSMGVALVSYDKAAFESYGLEGSANASVGFEAADAYAVALKALVQDALPRGGRSSLRVGETLFLFWTRDPTPDDFMAQFEAPEQESIARLISAPQEGTPDDAKVDTNEFYCLALSGNAARVIVRDYVEESLPRARDNVRAWFRDLLIASTRQDELGAPVAAFPLWLLAAQMTAPKAGNQPDWVRVNDLVPRLMAAALRHEPLPDSVLASCLGRLRAEGRDGFRPARMALMKLCLIRKGVPVSERLDPIESSPAYVCGQLLDVFDQIQRRALGDVRSTVVDKYYGGLSTAPKNLLGLLFKNAENHLRTLRTEKRTVAIALENRLALTARRLDAERLPAGQFTLAEQAVFALGYYHAKAERLERWAERRRQKALEQERRRAEKAAGTRG